jgi:hypothetical protein
MESMIGSEKTLHWAVGHSQSPPLILFVSTFGMD